MRPGGGCKPNPPKASGVTVRTIVDAQNHLQRIGDTPWGKPLLHKGIYSAGRCRSSDFGVMLRQKDISPSHRLTAGSLVTTAVNDGFNFDDSHGVRRIRSADPVETPSTEGIYPVLKCTLPLATRVHQSKESSHSLRWLCLRKLMRTEC